LYWKIVQAGVHEQLCQKSAARGMGKFELKGQDPRPLACRTAGER